MNQYQTLIKLFIFQLLLIVLVSCAFNTAPRYNIEPDTGAVQFVKRYPKYPAYQELFFWRTKEYRKNTDKLRWLLSEDQKEVISRYGQPDYLRRIFFSTRGDRVEEWVYWDKQRVVQFVEGQLVWDGMLTDYEKVLIIHGRPNKITVGTTEELQSRKVVMEYWRFLGSRYWLFCFVNDRMIIGKESL